jgi:RHS repeat-associated protein
LDTLLGSTSALTDASQTVTDTYAYNAFGEQIASTGTSINPFRYVGELGYYYDPDTTTYYVRARMYRPAIIRWLSEDPKWAQRYQYDYAWNRPTTLVDPQGASPIWSSQESATPSVFSLITS